jgi:REP element-mobilizing transposase RayT
MGRAWRIEYDGAFYHILSRGNERKDIFLDDKDRRTFLSVIGEMSERFEINLFAYVLMTNHYHLLIRTQHANLSKAMQWLGVTYTRRFNNRHSRSGHLFEGRFKSIIVQNDAYMMQLSCYIHRNPQRAGIVKRLADYMWSSYRAYAYGRAAPVWLSTELILDQFPSSERHKNYREKVQKYSKEEKRLWEDFRHGTFLGSKKFVEKIRKQYLPQKPHPEISGQRKLAKTINTDDIIDMVKNAFSCDIDRFVKSNRIYGADKDDRDLIIYFIWKTGMLTNEKIGALFGLTYSAVSHSVRSVKSRLQKDQALKEKLHQLNSQFKI